MAAHGPDGVELGTATTADFAAHERTYRGFLRLLKWSSIGIIVVMIYLFAFVF